MPFKEQSIVMQREEFCVLALMPGSNIRELCRRSGISPTTGYEWLQRYRGQGAAGLQDRSRRPLTSPWRTGEDIEALVVAVRQAHPAWGGRKIRKVLENDGLAGPPSASTITAILRRHQLLDGPGAGAPRDWVRFEHAGPNDLWQMDFKGHVEMTRGRLHPLTVVDDHSRYSVALHAADNERHLTVQNALQAAFERYGLPEVVLTDNGSPWGDSGEQELTKLGIWLIEHGVAPWHSPPLPSAEPRQERALQPHAQGRTARGPHL
jgi:transposase InsO family protein